VVGHRAPVISGDQNDKTEREKDQRVMAEKMRCSRWMVVVTPLGVKHAFISQSMIISISCMFIII
jgi:hypothetical protein